MNEIDWVRLDHRIYGKNEEGKVICEIEFPETGEGECTITHTFVDEDFGGQGLAGRLVKEAISVIQGRGEKVRATCPYARQWMKKHGMEEEA